jgi:shikimate dehydrogenase
MTPYAEVIGDPIAQSKSPLIHRFWLEALGLPGDYRSVHVTAAGLGDYFAGRRDDPAWRGCNITLPHKIAALDHVEDRGALRMSIGAMNTAFRAEDNAIVGTNTDAGGFFAPIAELDLAGQPVIVVGAGGAARAVLFALARIGAGPITILNRSPLKAAALLAHFELKGQVLPLGAALPPARLLVNTSALGMTGQPPLDLDLSPLPEDAVVYDIVYAPLETRLLRAARKRDLDTVDGLEMLVGQAAIAFEIFFGAEPPRDREDDLRALLIG